MKTGVTSSFVMLAVTLGSGGCANKQPTAPATDQRLVVDANTAFALDLYAQVRSQPGNLFLSPYSISTALAMTYAGARGQTAEEMAKVLHFPFWRRYSVGVFPRKWLTEWYKAPQSVTLPS